MLLKAAAGYSMAVCRILECSLSAPIGMCHVCVPHLLRGSRQQQQPQVTSQHKACGPGELLQATSTGANRCNRHARHTGHSLQHTTTQCQKFKSDPCTDERSNRHKVFYAEKRGTRCGNSSLPTAIPDLSAEQNKISHRPRPSSTEGNVTLLIHIARPKKVLCSNALGVERVCLRLPSPWKPVPATTCRTGKG